MNPLTYNYNLTIIYSLINSALKNKKKIKEINNPSEIPISINFILLIILLIIMNKNLSSRKLSI